jgi:hypothetical protein
MHRHCKKFAALSENHAKGIMGLGHLPFKQALRATLSF